MSTELIFDDLGTKIFNQYLLGTRNSILTNLSNPPTVGQSVILCKNVFTGIIRSTDDDFIRLTEEGASRIISSTPNPTSELYVASRITEDGFYRTTMTGAVMNAVLTTYDTEIFTTIISFTKLNCFLSSTDSYILKFG